MTASQDPCGGGRRSPVTAMGHDEPFPPPRPNGRCRVRKRSFGAEIEEGRQALSPTRPHTASVCLPHGDMRKRYGLYSEYVIHLLPPAAAPSGWGPCAGPVRRRASSMLKHAFPGARPLNPTAQAAAVAVLMAAAAGAVRREGGALPAVARVMPPLALR